MSNRIPKARLLSLAGALCAAILLALPGNALATPQVLGLVATDKPTPLQCENGICVGFFSTFCLEEERMPPSSWTAYRPTEDSDITLIVESADATTHRLPAGEFATFKTRLDFTSILASVDLARLAHLQPVRLSIAVGTLVSMLPEPSPQDTNPHTPEMLATITGPYRQTGKYFFDDGTGRSGTVAMVTRMINLLPQKGRVTPESRQSAFQAAQRQSPMRSGDATERFGAIVSGCEAMLKRTAERYNMRECLEYRHGVLQTRTNKEFWKALGGV